MPSVKQVLKEQTDINGVLLVLLQEAKFPKTISELVDALRVEECIANERSVKKAIKELEEEGYDIKEVREKEPKYGLVRWGSFDNSAYYKILGKVRLPCAFSADWHVGSKGFTRIGFNKFGNDCVKFGVKDIVMPGDLLQGLGVYPTEAMDVLDPSIDSQERKLVDLLKEFPKDTRFHAIIGNHEEKIKGKWEVGHDSMKTIATEVENFTYYGAVAKLQLKDNFTMLMMHGKGSVPYAVSYKGQKIYERLPEKPTIFVHGHIHQLMVLPTPPNHYIFVSGTLQRESSWLVQAGVVAQVGWIILNDINKEGADFKIRTPEVF